ncbi:DUF6879 family protein [Streptomyces marincola]|uniref:DUF6879 family protein n=1 Tax=Streptomyces marincola TaxID=2878388 RepID=UPI001CF22DC1|nr:DUF6879 family protein [Streptomyces marincola]UCM87515.1 hypothetical protein LC193_05890 [Streptomyces marincola]
MPSNVPPIAELLDATQHSAVHLETRDVYAVDPENAELAVWRRTGRRSGPDSEYWRPWVQLIRCTVARGVAVRRARIVSEPTTEYIRFEHAGTAVNVSAGEEVRWLPRKRTSDLLLPGNDFWLFDGRLLRIGHFSGDGYLAGHEVIRDSNVAGMCAKAFEAVWVRATPHDQYTIA